MKTLQLSTIFLVITLIASPSMVLAQQNQLLVSVTEKTNKTQSENQWKNFWVKGNYYNSTLDSELQVFKIRYNVEGGKVLKIVYDNKIANILVNIDSQTKGTLHITIPRNLPVTNSGNEESFPFIIVDGEETQFVEEKDECYRIFSIPFEKGNQEIELIGSLFGPAAIRPYGLKVPEECTITPSPRLQIEMNGVPFEQIKCDKELELIFKRTNSFPVCVKPETKTKLIERGWAKSTLDVLPANTLTGNLTVYILPYPTNEDYLGNIQKVSETIKSLGEINFIPFGEFGASKLGQYDNDEKIWKPSESVKFSIHHDVKESNGKTVTVDDISENMLFGNAIAFGGVGLKDGSAPAATIIVVDSSFESIMNPIIDELTSLLTGQKTWVEIDPIQCGGNPWEKDWLESHPDDFSIYARLITNEKIELIKNYYKKQDIEIFDVKSFPWEDVVVCESCSCPAGYTLSLLVSNSDVDKMLEFGYKISKNQR